MPHALRGTFAPLRQVQTGNPAPWAHTTTTLDCGRSHSANPVQGETTAIGMPVSCHQVPVRLDTTVSTEWIDPVPLAGIRPRSTELVYSMVRPSISKLGNIVIFFNLFCMFAKCSFNNSFRALFCVL